MGSDVSPSELPLHFTVPIFQFMLENNDKNAAK